jgi:O-antigen/teichoic acid export membrane protein
MREALKIFGRALTHQSMVGQLVSALSAVVVVAILSRFLPEEDYAHYAVVTAIWAIGNAVVGTGVGTRIARIAAEGSTKICFRPSELYVAGFVSVVSGIYVAWLRASCLDGAIAAACMMTFVLAEASISFEIGAARFKRYLFLLILRVVTPFFVLLGCVLIGSLSVTLAFLSVLAGNTLSLLPWFRRWSIRPYIGPSYSSHLVGALNLGLWVVASADRVVLEMYVEPTALAVYAITYGLLDKFFRSLSNAFIARSLGASFSGRNIIPSKKFFGSSLLLFVVMVPVGKWAVEFVSGSRYSPDLALVAVIAAAGMAMLWSAPYYVGLLASAEYRGSLWVIGIIAGFNIFANVVFDRLYGVSAAAMISLCSYLLWLVWLVFRSRRVSIIL